MITTIYIVIVCYFIAGGIGFHFINRKRDRETARTNNIKLLTYFIIINVLFFSIVLFPSFFQALAALIVIGGYVELVRLYKSQGYSNHVFFALSLLLYSGLAVGFFRFSSLAEDREGLVLFSFLVLSIFDSFSQITGQLWGSRKLVPSISPNKTLGGLIGGGVIALVSVAALRGLHGLPWPQTWALGIGLLLAAFVGDLAASLYKRRYRAKDFSRAIPGHGGILDRFDSLITGGALVAACYPFFQTA